ncbi:HAD hydrolase-like protein [uncultured Sphingomonas sp.]|uniref:HAD hydrolase-like protein n=1 Tax=unclassified Sphingomonas TaxID=196159 RepID=UPI0025D3F7B4|nr:HAD hydrolase-like protein [uncultured Sphingomonas sp.]
MIAMPARTSIRRPPAHQFAAAPGAAMSWKPSADLCGSGGARTSPKRRGGSAQSCVSATFSDPLDVMAGETGSTGNARLRVCGPRQTGARSTHFRLVLRESVEQSMPRRHPAAMRYDLAVFDFDGTLADTTDWFFGCLNEVADKYEFRKTTDGERQVLRRLASREIIKQLGVPMWRMPAIARHMRRRASANVESFRLFPGIDAQLALLHESGMRIAVVSSNAESNVRAVLGPTLSTQMSLLSCGSSMFGKAAKLRGAMKKVGVTRERTIYVGDEARDIEAAHQAGIASAAVTWGYAHHEALDREQPTLMLNSVSALRKLLD